MYRQIVISIRLKHILKIFIKKTQLSIYLHLNKSVTSYDLKAKVIT